MKTLLLLLIPAITFAQVNETAEFAKLMRTPAFVSAAELLKLDPAPLGSDSLTLSIQNKSQCNVILRIKSTTETFKSFSIPVPGNSTKIFALKKDDYIFSSWVCSKWFYTRNNLQK